MATKIETKSKQTNPAATSVGLDETLHKGSLRSKLVLSLAAVFMIFLIVNEVVRNSIIEPEFAALERAGAARDASRVMAAINAEVGHLGQLSQQIASQVAMKNRAPEDALPSSQGLAFVQNLDWAAIRLEDGSLEWLGLQDDSRTAIDQSTRELEHQITELVGVCAKTKETVSGGLTCLKNDALAIISLVPICDSDGQTAGHLIAARELDTDFLAMLRRQTQVDFEIESPCKNGSKINLLQIDKDPSWLVAEVHLTGLKQEHLADMRVKVPREITARSTRTTFLARNTYIFGSVATLLVFLLMLQRIIIGPLTEMREHSDRVASEGLDTKPLQLYGNDEIGHLANAFDNMVSRLSDAQSQLKIASQAAGRSEVASTVIHNVGNVLTNVNSLLDAASSRVSKLRIAPIDKLATQLRVSGGNEELLDATPDYLEGLAGSLVSEQDAISELLATLNDNVRHIHDVIRDQQRHASTAVKLASIALPEIIDEAIRCCQARLNQDSVEVCVTGSRTAAAKADHSLLLQTLINVIGNARNAMSDNDRERRLTIDVQAETEIAKITLTDTGCGMTEETLSQVFDAHFTTRATGSGLGLHFCANTLKKLGGAIYVSSDGLGKGSRFIIELPNAVTANFPNNQSTYTSLASDLQAAR